MSEYAESVGAYPPMSVASPKAEDVLLPENPVESGILAGVRFAVEIFDRMVNSVLDKDALTNELAEILIQSYRDGTLFDPPEATDVR